MCVIFGTCCPLWFENEIIRCEMLSNIEKRDWNKRHIPWENDSYSQKRSPINSRPKVKQKLWNCREGQPNDACGLRLRIFPWENDMIPNPQNTAPVSCDTRQAHNFASRSLFASLAAMLYIHIYSDIELVAGCQIDSLARSDLLLFRSLSYKSPCCQVSHHRSDLDITRRRGQKSTYVEGFVLSHKVLVGSLSSGFPWFQMPTLCRTSHADGQRYALMWRMCLDNHAALSWAKFTKLLCKSLTNLDPPSTQQA